MTELQQSRYDRIMRRVGDLKGPGSKVSEVLSEVFPVVNLEDIPPELLLLGQTIPGYGGGFITSIAGQGPTAQLFNPAGSSKLVTITDVHVAHDAVGTMRWGVSPPARGTVISTQQSLDTRMIVPNVPVAQVRQESAVALATATAQTRQLANTNLHLSARNGLAVLAPGTGFEIGSAVLTSSLFYVFYWTERVAEPSELNL